MSKKKPAPRGDKKTGKKRKPGGRPFVKGGPGGPGRPKGSQNHSTVEFKKFCREATSQTAFLEYLCSKLRSGKLRSELVRTLWAYGHGRPPVAIDVSVDFNPRDYLSRDEEAPDD